MGTCVLVIVLLASVSFLTRSEDQISVISGDVVIGAFSEVNELENGVCGEFSPELLEEVVAVAWFLQSLNDRKFIPGIKIGLDIFRTCSSTERAVNGTFRLLSQYLAGDDINGSAVLFGLLGPGRTEEAKAVSRWLSSLPPDKRLLQISGSATGSDLSDKTLYPNFFRVIPPDTNQVKVLHALLLKLDWNYIAIVYDDDNYGRPLAAELRRLSEQTDICVPVFTSLPLDSRSSLFETTASVIVQQMKSTSGSLVRGVVILGSSSTMNRLIQKLGDNIRYVNLVLGETVALQQTNLQTTTGQLVPIARGALITSPPYFPLPEFQSFWKELWTNRTLFTDYAVKIPWLSEFFEQLTSCNFNKQPGCWDTKKDLYSGTFGKISKENVSLYTAYQLKATAVMAALLKQEQGKRCYSSSTALCLELLNLIKDRISLLDILQNATLSLQEFATQLYSFANNTVSSFYQNGDIEVKQGATDYTVYNFRQNGGGDFGFKQVASFTGDELIIREPDVIFYTETGSPLPWAQRPLAQCDVNHDCPQCEDDVADDVVFIEGDFYVVGIMPIFNKSPLSPLWCDKIRTIAGADLAESLIFALKQINEKEGLFENILPGRKIGLLLINSCSSPLLVRQRLLDLHTSRLLLPGQTVRNSSVILSNIMGYVGAYSSGESLAAADILTTIGRPFVQISPSSTSAELKNRSLYPYFLRLVPADDIQAQILLQVAVRLNATYIQIMYDQTAAYPLGLVQKIEEAVKYNFTGVCIAQKIPIAPAEEVSEYKWIKDELRKKSAARLVIVVVYPTEIQQIMNAILPDFTAKDNFLFLASQSWGRRQELIEDKIKLEGSLVFDQEIPIDVTFDTYFKSLNATQTENVWLRYFWEARKSCYFDGSFEREGKSGPCPANIAADYVDDPRLSLHIQATYALVIGFNQAFTRLCSPSANHLCDTLTSDELVKSLKNVKLDVYNTGERTQLFDDNGDGLVGFKILQVTRDRTISENAMVYREVGLWTHQTLVLNEKSLTPPGGKTFTSVCPTQEECASCLPKGTLTPSGEKALENTSAVVGLSVALAVVSITQVVLIIFLCRRLRTTAPNQGCTTSTAQMAKSENNDGKLSASSEPDYYTAAFDSATNSSQEPRYGVDTMFEESQGIVITFPPPLCNSLERTNYLTAVN